MREVEIGVWAGWTLFRALDFEDENTYFLRDGLSTLGPFSSEAEAIEQAEHTDHVGYFDVEAMS